MAPSRRDAAGEGPGKVHSSAVRGGAPWLGLAPGRPFRCHHPQLCL
ncbi:hypothetical protein EYF80_062456 [Liparis tanakae]|uniref:Uncharacterized protein n=1 Tax=Liparis tanakae TaxID=230148 RepID=A0A4Z2EFT2_9TELE|nr:hypothetical protein EYF80_062456 [Liparis tanakae]